MPTEARVVVVPQEQGQALEVVDVTLPDPGPNQVVVRQFASGICTANCTPFTTPDKHRRYLVHESTGVEVVGESVTDLKPGDTVMVTWVPKNQHQARRQGGAHGVGTTRWPNSDKHQCVHVGHSHHRRRNVRCEGTR